MPDPNLNSPTDDSSFEEQEANTAAINNQLINSNKKQEKTQANLKDMKDQLSSLIRIGTVVKPSDEEIKKEIKLQKSKTELGHPIARVLVHIGKNNTGRAEKIDKIEDTFDEELNIFNTKIPHLKEFKEAAQIISSKIEKTTLNKSNNREEDSNIRIWIQFTARNAGVDAEWSPPSYGEQVLILCNNGYLSDAYIIGSLYRSSVNSQRIPSWIKDVKTNDQDPFKETNFPEFINDLEFPTLGKKNHQKHIQVFGSSGLIVFDPESKTYSIYLFTAVKDNENSNEYRVLKLFDLIQQLIQEGKGGPAHGERIQKIFHSDSPDKPLVTEKTTIKSPDPASSNSHDGSVSPKIKKNEQITSGVHVGSVSTKIYSSKVARTPSQTTTDDEDKGLLASEELTVNSDLGGDKKISLHRIGDNGQAAASFNNLISVTGKGVETRQELKANETKNSRQIITCSRVEEDSSLLSTSLNSTASDEGTLALFQLTSQKQGDKGNVILEAHSKSGAFCKLEMDPTQGLTISTSASTSININKDGVMTVNATKIKIDAPVEFTKKIICSSDLDVRGKLNVI